MKGGELSYRDPVLLFDALRLVALRKAEMTEEALATENEREMLIRAPAHALSATKLFAAGEQLAAHSQPALRTGSMAPVWRPALCIRGVIPTLPGVFGCSSAPRPQFPRQC